MTSNSELQQLQQQFMNYVLGESADIESRIESTPALSAKGRLDIYASAYKSRLKEAIATDYDKLYSFLGDEQFDSLMECYIDTYPSHTTSLRYFSCEMPTLLKQAEPFKQLPVLAEIALIEQAFANSFDAEDHRFATINDLATLPTELWANLRFKFQKSVQLLPMEYNSIAIWKALSDQQTPPDIVKTDIKEYWVLWRKAELVSHYRPLSNAEYAAITLAKQGEDFAVICEALLDFFSEDETPVKAIGFIQSWIQEEMIAELTTD